MNIDDVIKRTSTILRWISNLLFLYMIVGFCIILWIVSGNIVIGSILILLHILLFLYLYFKTNITYVLGILLLCSTGYSMLPLICLIVAIILTCLSNILRAGHLVPNNISLDDIYIEHFVKNPLVTTFITLVIASLIAFIVDYFVLSILLSVLFWLIITIKSHFDLKSDAEAKRLFGIEQIKSYNRRYLMLYLSLISLYIVDTLLISYMVSTTLC